MDRKNDTMQRSIQSGHFIDVKNNQIVKKRLFDVLNQRFLMTYSPLIFAYFYMRRLS